ncbi:hypothetical protein [Streptomyces sp. NBC_01477]|uniref:hypothetical protein n=1 Tax=Streptomyces sp. NBC_01477 TaxID=2976015 RepID=UPI002E348558|nr:hypothetical protein [Streptomyces sp. NBC_01477]
MPVEVVPLLMFGLVCLLAGIMGESVEAGNVKLPALKKKQVRAAAAAIGVVALLLGMMVFLRDGPDPGDDSGADGPNGPTTTLSSAPFTIPSTTPPASTPADVVPSLAPRESVTQPSEPEPVSAGVRWHGTLTLDGENMQTGWALDSVPPSRALTGDIGLICQLVCETGQMWGNALASWSGASPPTREQCRDRLNTTVGTQQLEAEPGTMGCVGTTDMRIAYFKMLTMRGSHMTLEAMVWELPPE